MAVITQKHYQLQFPQQMVLGSGAVAVANVTAQGNIDSIFITTAGSGYATTPTITVLDASTRLTGNANVVITIAGETSKSGGNGLAKYITKKVVLDEGFDSGDLRVYFTAYRPVNTNIYVYYKILSRTDTQLFDDGNWQLMTLINSGDSKFSQNRNNLYEYVAALRKLAALLKIMFHTPVQLMAKHTTDLVSLQLK